MRLGTCSARPLRNALGGGMRLGKKAYIALLSAGIAVAVVAARDAPPIGAGARFQSDELGRGWHRGFFNEIRTATPCYIVMTFELRTSSEQPLRVNHMILVDRIQRLQVTTAPGTSMQEWDSLVPPAVPESLWDELKLASLRPGAGECRLDETLG